MMHEIGHAYIHHIAARVQNRFLQILVVFGDVMLFRELGCAHRASRKHRHNLYVRHKATVRFEMDVADESGPEQRNFGFSHKPLPS